ncbi:hypothetical protein ACM6Q7_06935 [Peribacillus butanolivorans]|uniref:hypothetical protein n=1 Tax=Peribacillus butanolivorans TaxID=421767 RepID=UPI0039FC721F
MGSLVIEQVIYKGDTYTYSSPIFKKGLQIIEAENGGGKTTFSSLICYGLGMYVKQFDFKRNEYHKEIQNDTNNYVELKILINEEHFKLKRYFSGKNGNMIFLDGEEEEKYFYVSRNALTNKEGLIFSDWLLERLGIKVFDIFQGTKRFKINFSDLFRLIHYDQASSPLKVYKEHRSDNNFVSDSSEIRKVIFEILMGYRFSDYYAKLGELKRAEKDRNTHKATLDNYESIYQETGVELSTLQLQDIEGKIENLNKQLVKIELYRSSLNNSIPNISKSDKHLQKLRSDAYNLDEDLSELEKSKKLLLEEHNDLNKVKENLILEVTQIKKIILTNEELNIFSPNTCPCCLKEINRKVTQCICGNDLDEEYRRYFYSSDEYLELLKSKQKTVETMDIAINSVISDFKETKRKYTEKKSRKEEVVNTINSMHLELSNFTNLAEISELNNNILKIKEQIQNNIHLKSIFEHLNKLKQAYNLAESELNGLKKSLSILENTLNIKMQKTLNEFSTIYFNMIKKVDSTINSVDIDDNYLPIINGGIYMQASSHVVRRMVFYITMLYLTIKNNDVSFPYFILMDTPENLGIDEENLVKCLELIDELFELDEDLGKEIDFQIILTTGLGKYPEKYKDYVVETLTKQDKLLKENSK